MFEVNPEAWKKCAKTSQVIPTPYMEYLSSSSHSFVLDRNLL